MKKALKSCVRWQLENQIIGSIEDFDFECFWILHRASELAGIEVCESSRVTDTRDFTILQNPKIVEIQQIFTMTINSAGSYIDASQVFVS
jgi:hypothetical protein